MHKKGSRYSESFKELAVGQVLEGEGITQIARRLNLSLPTLSKWVKDKKEKDLLADGVPTKKEYEQLKRQLEKEKIKNSILKKTLKIFSSEGEIDIL